MYEWAFVCDLELVKKESFCYVRQCECTTGVEDHDVLLCQKAVDDNEKTYIQNVAKYTVKLFASRKLLLKLKELRGNSPVHLMCCDTSNTYISSMNNSKDPCSGPCSGS